MVTPIFPSSSGKIFTATPSIQNMSMLPPRWNQIPVTYPTMMQRGFNEQELHHCPFLLQFSLPLAFSRNGRVVWRWGQTMWKNSKHQYPRKWGDKVCFYLFSALGTGWVKWQWVTCGFPECNHSRSQDKLKFPHWFFFSFLFFPTDIQTRMESTTSVQKLQSGLGWI